MAAPSASSCLHDPSSASPGNAKDVPGTSTLPLSQRVLTGAASIIQDFQPTTSLCAHLHAFHVFASDPTRTPSPAHHFCAHITSDVRQCLLYDSNSPSARLIGVEYMVTPELFATLPAEEKKLWHSHVFEVKSGMLVMPQPADSVVPKALWEKAELKEMEETIKWYGKVWQTWDVDRNPEIPLGRPELMMSFTKETKGMREAVEKRDMEMFGEIVYKDKAKRREEIPWYETDKEADAWEQDLLP